MSEETVLTAMAITVLLLAAALATFFVGFILADEKTEWKRFKRVWAVFTIVDSGLALATLLFTQTEFIVNLWLLVCGGAGVSGLKLFALGAEVGNRTYRPEGKHPLGLSVEAQIIVIVSLVAGVIWAAAPDGLSSSGIFGAALCLFVGYIHFGTGKELDKPNGDLKGDLGSLIISFVVELTMLFVLAFAAAAVFVVLSEAVEFLRGDPSKSWLGQSGLFQSTLLVVWVLVNAAIWRLTKPPKEKLYPNHLYSGH